ncbi:MAG: hypothetical protein AAGM21_02815 [Pseudomonadota bacterium]
MKTGLLSALAIALAFGAATAQEHGAEAPYAGYETRAIKSLSDADIAELRRGGGWGLALPAELNGKPGPAHLLELRDDLGLSAAQIAKVTEIYEAMREDAILAGERLIAAEAALSAAFEGPGLTAPELSALVGKAETARADLRVVHLSRHLETSALLTEDQIGAYQILRGYAQDPCDSVPDGHDAELWKRHNGCG